MLLQIIPDLYLFHIKFAVFKCLWRKYGRRLYW